uniref:Uncharacterized protein n=1 Tax=Alexandrium monilatum TaxID=311494 RepID=A0A7S4T1C4_9DINO
MAFDLYSNDQLASMGWEKGLDNLAPQILLKGLGRPWKLYGAHAAVFGANYGGFLALVWRDLLRLLPGRRAGPAGTPAENEEKERRKKRSLAMLVFVKFLVWQHLAEAIGCRQGPLGGYFGFPNNWKFRLSLGTLKYPMLPFLGKRRNIVDLFVHVLFFISGIAFLQAKEYKLKYIRTLCACDVWLALSDLSQFFASTGHAYFSMLLSACFAEDQGRLAGIQAGLLIQWFFSGVGKIGPWFSYVNGPFMLQSRFFAGQRWLFNLLIQSPGNLAPTLFGKVFAHTAAAVEYLAPIALMCPKGTQPALADSTERSGPEESTAAAPAVTAPEGGSALAEPTAPSPKEVALVPVRAKPKHRRLARAVVWLGLTGIVGMHGYILSMPAPFDVYSWNMSFLISAIYLFFYGNFGFDHRGARTMNRGLVAWLVGEFLFCWYGQFYPDRVGYYLSHRYWAGNWVQTFFYVKNTAAHKLARVKWYSSRPQIWRSLEPLGMKTGMTNFAYLWLANFNMKAAVGLILQGVKLAGGAGAKLQDYFPMGLMQFCCGEFRDALYALPLLPAIQEQIGFEAGECFMVRLGAFGMGRETATYGIYDLKGGLLKGGVLSLSALAKMDAFPSQSIAALAD